MTSLVTGEFYCWGCAKYKSIEAKGDSPTTKPHCKMCVEQYKKRHSPKGVAQRKLNLAKAKKLYTDEKRLSESIKYFTRGGG